MLDFSKHMIFIRYFNSDTDYMIILESEFLEKAEFDDKLVSFYDTTNKLFGWADTDKNIIIDNCFDLEGFNFGFSYITNKYGKYLMNPEGILCKWNPRKDYTNNAVMAKKFVYEYKQLSHLTKYIFRKLYD